MIVSILSEHGYDEAILGLSLSYGVLIGQAQKVSIVLSKRDGGENKFLESIYVWLDVNAPRFWWQEADTYRLSTKQSESTMHTLHKRDLIQNDFEYEIDGAYLQELNRTIAQYRNNKENSLLAEIKGLLPEGFLQRRIWVMNYKCLRNILLQRSTHKLPQWQSFCNFIQNNIQHPELLPK